MFAGLRRDYSVGFGWPQFEQSKFWKASGSSGIQANFQRIASIDIYRREATNWLKKWVFNPT